MLTFPTLTDSSSRESRASALNAVRAASDARMPAIMASDTGKATRQLIRRLARRDWGVMTPAQAMLAISMGQDNGKTLHSAPHDLLDVPDLSPEEGAQVKAHLDTASTTKELNSLIHVLNLPKAKRAKLLGWMAWCCAPERTQKELQAIFAPYVAANFTASRDGTTRLPKLCPHGLQGWMLTRELLPPLPRAPTLLDWMLSDGGL